MSTPEDLPTGRAPTDAPKGPIEHGILWINRAFLAFGAVFVMLMMLHVTLDVGLRAAVNGRLVGTLEIVSYYYMILLVLLPMGFVEMRHEHIRVDLFAQMMPRSVQLGLYIFACLLGMLYFGLLTWQTFDDAWSSTLRQETIMSNRIFYIWPSRWALPVGFAGIFLAILGNLLKAIRLRRAL
jgi:TRAP-type C4-dicarboxylate transport system permease small subunit